MYKTIRHGENSLQYTILPQNDDFRIEGKLTSAESSCSSTGRKPKTKRPRRRSFFAYIGLIFVCTVIVGAVLIPFLVSVECLPNPSDWFLGKNIDNKHDKPTSLGLKGHTNSGLNAAHNNFISSGINIGKTVKIINQASVEKIVLRTNKTRSNSNSTENQKFNLISKLNNQNGGVHVVEQTNDHENPSATNATSMINIQLDTTNEIEKLQINKEIDIKAQNFESLNQNPNSLIQNVQLKGDRGSVQTHEEASAANAGEIKQDLYKKLKDIPQNEHFVTEVRFEPVETASSSPSIGVIPTIVVTTLRNQASNSQLRVQQAPQQQFTVQSQTAPNIRPTTISNSALATINESGSIASTTPLQTRIIQVPLLKAAAKKPIIPPVLVRTNSQLTTANDLRPVGNNNLVKATLLTTPTQTLDNVNNANSIETPAASAKADDWIHAHWPYVDPSTYFQWTGYKAEDSVLLPALLGFALIGVVLSITVCLVLRNKYAIASSVRKRNRNVSDLEGNGAEDNTTLLTSTNLSDED